jgi:ribonucleoside-triphosphate reductase
LEIDTSPEGRLVIKAFLKGLRKGETSIFPISIFKVKEGINDNPSDPNYDLFQITTRVSENRLFPNFLFFDAPVNVQYYKFGDYRTEVATVECRTRAIGSIFPESDWIITSRGNLSFTTINLPRIGIKHGICLDKRLVLVWKGFYKDLDSTIDLVVE